MMANVWLKVFFSAKRPLIFLPHWLSPVISRRSNRSLHIRINTPWKHWSSVRIRIDKSTNRWWKNRWWLRVSLVYSRTLMIERSFGKKLCNRRNCLERPCGSLRTISTNIFGTNFWRKQRWKFPRDPKRWWSTFVSSIGSYNWIRWWVCTL